MYNFNRLVDLVDFGFQNAGIINHSGIVNHSKIVTYSDPSIIHKWARIRQSLEEIEAPKSLGVE